MAKAYQCDRCGAFYSRTSGCGQYEVKVRLVDPCKDLCPKCGEELEMWMENKAEFVSKEGDDKEGAEE